MTESGATKWNEAWHQSEPTKKSQSPICKRSLHCIWVKTFWQ